MNKDGLTGKAINASGMSHEGGDSNGHGAGSLKLLREWSHKAKWQS
jgi:hypothetical protein